MSHSPSRTSVNEERLYRFRLLGTGAADPTVEIGGRDVSADETATGVYLITWKYAPGLFIGWSYGFGAATPADLKGFTAVRDTFDTTNQQLEIRVYNASGTLADLAATQYIDVCVAFAESESP